MSCQNYRVIELQNDNIGAVAVNGFMPLGRVTRRISKTTGAGVPFSVITSGADTVQRTDKGTYKAIYSASLVVAAAGDVTVTLLANGVPLYSVTETAAGAGTVNLTLPKEVRVFANCAANSTNCPVDLQIQLTGSAITGGKSNFIVDSCVNG